MRIYNIMTSDRLLYHSPVFGEDVWIVSGERVRDEIRRTGDDRVIYLRSELAPMKGLAEDVQRKIHDIKRQTGGTLAGIEPPKGTK